MATSLRVLHVVPQVHNASQGPSYSVMSLCAELARAGNEVSLHVALPLPAAPPPEVAMVGYPRASWTGRLQWTPGMRKGVALAARAADVIHNHSLWLPANVQAARAARLAGKPLVNSPRGTLSAVALRRRGLAKRLLWHFGQGQAVARSACLHATSELEYLDFRRARLVNPVAVIPNGVDIPEASGRLASSDRRQVLYLGRLHPIKGIDLLLRAWRGLQGELPGWDLVIAGAGEPRHEKALRGLAAELGVSRTRFVGSVFGEEKLRLLAGSELYILPSHTENFGMTVAEALASSVPVITTRGTPWPGLESHGCGWWVDDNSAAIEAALRGAMMLPARKLQEMGSNGRAWVASEFSWSSVGQRMLEMYSWILHGGPAPACVRLS